MNALHTQVLTWVFVLALLFGALLQKTHFCTMGALSDVLLMGDSTRLRQWALAVAVAMLGFALLGYSGQIDVGKTIYAGKRLYWLSALCGGALFGLGMVLASGCGSKTLVRLGGGNLKSLVVVLAMGVAAMMSLKGWFGLWRVQTLDLFFIDVTQPPTLTTVMHQLGVPQAYAGLVGALLLATPLAAWALCRADFWRLDNLLAGFGVGALITAAWWVSGHLGHVLEHPQTLDEVFVATNSGLMESFTFAAPMGYALDGLMYASDTSKRLSMGVVSLVGVVLGSAASALWSRQFRWEGFSRTEDLVSHLLGAVLMGAGGVMALGCTVGQGLSGVSTLALGSFIAVAGIAGGAWLGFRVAAWRMGV